jgi:hypothetical protein
MKPLRMLVVAVALGWVVPAMADEESLAPGAGVILVRQAAHVSKLSLLRRGVELTSLDDDTKSKFFVVLDPFIESQQKLIDDAAAHHENSTKNQKSAEDGMRASGPKIQEIIGSVDGQKLGEGMKSAMIEELIFTESWPMGQNPDPLPALVKVSGLDEKTAASIQRIRDDYVFHAKLSLTEDQTLAAIGAIDVQIDKKFWADERVGIGIRSAAKARELLTPEQRVKWDAAIRSLAGVKPA